MKNMEARDDSESVAVIGMVCRFPGAKNVDEYWQNLRAGVESITFFTDEYLLANGVSPAKMRHPSFVKAGGVLEDIDLFDASFFGYSPREAEIIDPQQRIFLECAYEALENAGCNPDKYPGAIGVFGASGMPAYLFTNLMKNAEVSQSAGSDYLRIANRLDNLTTRVSYKLNLKGPSIAVQTGCSASMVAVHLACQSLLNGECDLALAGGVRISPARNRGYLYLEGGIVSPDGHCRAFDMEAKGTVGGDGVGIVVLKRLEDARRDRDNLRAVIRGSAVNNDGAVKVGYTAPGIVGQAAVISEALVVAGVGAETISYVETHGTGTALGDPIEIAALTQAFRREVKEKGQCAIGSVKSNMGHLDVAAGVAGLIKTILALEHRELPASLHYRRPNPEIALEESPFYVNDRLAYWEGRAGVRRAGVSSFGIGGTNAHVIVEEASVEKSEAHSGRREILVLSAMSQEALEESRRRLRAYLLREDAAALEDVAYTLQVGRRELPERWAAVVSDREAAVRELEQGASGSGVEGSAGKRGRGVIYLIGGQGTQYVGIGRKLYEEVKTYREEIDRCSEIAKVELGLDVREVMYADVECAAARAEMEETRTGQVVIYMVGYALGRVLLEWGVEPAGMIGHSVGEYTAATLAGVMSVEDGVRLVCRRGRLMQRTRIGGMTAVGAGEDVVRGVLRQGVGVAVINGPKQRVVSGELESLAEVERELKRMGVAYRRLNSKRGFHSEMMKEVEEEFVREVAKVNLRAPEARYVSTVSGKWIKKEDAMEPGYWGRHLTQCVRFWEGLQELERDGDQMLVELGGGGTLINLARESRIWGGKFHAVSVLGRGKREEDGEAERALAEMWAHGVSVDWTKYQRGRRARRVALPTYPFSRQSFWVEPQDSAPEQPHLHHKTDRNSEVREWFYIPSWKRSLLSEPPEPDEESDTAPLWAIFTYGAIGRQLLELLQQQGGRKLIVIAPGQSFAREAQYSFTIDTTNPGDYDALLREIQRINGRLRKVIHLWSIAPASDDSSSPSDFNQFQYLGLYSLLWLTRALGKHNFNHPIQIQVISNQIRQVSDCDVIIPEKTIILGGLKTISQEYPNITTRSIDIVLPKSGGRQWMRTVNQLAAEILSSASDRVVAYRGVDRWTQTFEPLALQARYKAPLKLRERGVYLITGGTGRIGLTLAEFLARTVNAHLILMSRSASKDAAGAAMIGGGNNTPIYQREKLRSLEEMGAELLFIDADVSDEEQVLEAIAQAERRFGAIQGVIHCAGITRSYQSIQEMDVDECERHFRAKVSGTAVLGKAFKSKELDFVILQSSLSSILGGLGYFAHAAANQFMDAYARRQCGESFTSWMSVNWDGWRFGEKGLPRAVGADAHELAISPEEGVAAFEYLLRMTTLDQVIVSTSNLENRVRRWVNLEPVQAAQRPARRYAPAITNQSSPDDVYPAARSEAEKIIAAVWQELLGLEHVGVNDNFFDLGGHSLLGVQLTARLREIFCVDIPLRSLFEHPTVAKIAEVIESRLIDEINQLSEEEVSKLL
jgi:acyl transferase domain-containing protein/acyl carrier protein